jgi:hypothetical protein
MAEVQEMFDFPPAPKLNVLGRLDRSKATPGEIRGEELFFGKANCASRHGVLCRSARRCPQMERRSIVLVRTAQTVAQ